MAVSLPERTAYAAYPAQRKPMATIDIVLSDGSKRTINLPVRAAKQINTDELASLSDVEAVFKRIADIQRKECFNLLVEMLSRRDHSISEARGKLSRHGFLTVDIDDAIQRACSKRFLDDGRFARYFIDERKRRGWGRLRIEIELKRRGVDAHSIQGYPEEFFSIEDDAERARVLLEKRRVPESRPFEKLVRFLMGKGFSYGLSAQVVREVLGESGDD